MLHKGEKLTPKICCINHHIGDSGIPFLALIFSLLGLLAPDVLAPSEASFAAGLNPRRKSAPRISRNPTLWTLKESNGFAEFGTQGLVLLEEGLTNLKRGPQPEVSSLRSGGGIKPCLSRGKGQRFSPPSRNLPEKKKESKRQLQKMLKHYVFL